MAGAAAFKAHGADCVIGFGGGAALDVAKVVGVMATHAGDVLEYVWDHPQVRPITQRTALLRRAAHHLGHRLARSAARRWCRENDTHHQAHRCSAPKILAKAVFADPELTLALPRAGHRRHRHGRADAQHRELPVAGLPPAVRRHRARGPAHRRARAGHRGARAGQPAGARRHDDELDDGRHRLPEGPGLGACLRARAGRGVRPAPRPGQRADDRHRAGLEPRGRAGEVRRTGARRRRRGAAAARRSSAGCAR